jgi:hypothetical protein
VSKRITRFEIKILELAQGWKLNEKFERGFVENLHTRLKEYGENMLLTPKQRRALWNLLNFRSWDDEELREIANQRHAFFEVWEMARREEHSCKNPCYACLSESRDAWYSRQAAQHLESEEGEIEVDDSAVPF